MSCTLLSPTAKPAKRKSTKYGIRKKTITQTNTIKKQLLIKMKLSFCKKEYSPYEDFLGLLIIKIANEKSGLGISILISKQTEWYWRTFLKNYY